MAKKKITQADSDKLDKLSMWSSPKRGRPIKWTNEAIDELAKELLEFAEERTSLVLSSFVLQKRMNPDILSYLAGLSSNFFEALNTARRLIGARRETGTLLKKFEPKTYSMSQRMYDPDWSKHLDAQLSIDELIKAKAKIIALENVLDGKNKGAIKEYLEMQKKLDDATK